MKTLLSTKDVAYELITECYNLKDIAPIITNNIDYEKIGREIEMDGRHFVEGNTVFGDSRRSRRELEAFITQ